MLAPHRVSPPRQLDLARSRRVEPGSSSWAKGLRSNQGHHDFQSCQTYFWVLLEVSKTAYLGYILISYIAACFRLFTWATVKLLSEVTLLPSTSPVQRNPLHRVPQYLTSAKELDTVAAIKTKN